MIGIVISCILLGFIIGFIIGGHYEIDSCSKNIDDSVILEHIKECIFNKTITDENKILFIKSILE
jgi:hypothetical protein